MNETSTSKLVNLRELARQLRRFGITHVWLKQEAEAGRLPCMHTGKRLLFNTQAVEDALLRRAAGGKVDE